MTRFEYLYIMITALGLTHSSEGFNPLSLAQLHSDTFEDLLDVIARLT